MIGRSACVMDKAFATLPWHAEASSWFPWTNPNSAYVNPCSFVNCLTSSLAQIVAWQTTWRWRSGKQQSTVKSLAESSSMRPLMVIFHLIMTFKSYNQLKGSASLPQPEGVANCIMRSDRKHQCCSTASGVRETRRKLPEVSTICHPMTGEWPLWDYSMTISYVVWVEHITDRNVKVGEAGCSGQFQLEFEFSAGTPAGLPSL